MIKLRFTEASRFENSILNKDFSVPIKKRKMFMGRGEELHEKESQTNGIIDLTNFDNTLSRVHASFNFSPACSIILILHYVSTIEINFLAFVNNLELSETKKVLYPERLEEQSGDIQESRLRIDLDRKEMVIEFVHQSFITFNYCEQYENLEELIKRIQEIKKQQQRLIVFGNLKKITYDFENCHNEIEKKQFLKIWRFSVKETQYMLLIQNGLVLRIGRSSHCEVQVKDTAISRYQSYLKCQERKWRIIDGNPIEKSKNGTWKKCKNIEIQLSTNQNSIVKNYVKIGTIKCEIQVIQNFEWLNIQKIVNQDTSKSFIEIGMQNQDHQQQLLEQKDEI